MLSHEWKAIYVRKDVRTIGCRGMTLHTDGTMIASLAALHIWQRSYIICIWDNG